MLRFRWRFRILVWDSPAGDTVLMATPLIIAVTLCVRLTKLLGFRVDTTAYEERGCGRVKHIHHRHRG